MGARGTGRLNFIVPEHIEQKLEVYCEQTTRSPADVIRQLVSEWLEGDRKLKTPATVHPAGRRTNIPLGYAALAHLDEQVRVEKHVTVSAVIAALLDEFLSKRTVMPTEELVSVRVQLPTSDYNALVAKFEREGTTIATGLARAAGIIAHSQRAFNKPSTSKKH